MGIEVLIAMLVGLFAIAGAASGGSDDDDTSGQSDVSETEGTSDTPSILDEVDSDTPSILEDDEIEAEDSKASITGTDDNDEIFGDDMIGDISGKAGDDFIISFGADGVLNGGGGADTIALTSGEGTLVGAGGQDIFFVLGDDENDEPTNAVIKDFNIEKDKLLLTFQQSSIKEGDVEGSSSNIQLSREEIETDDGIAVKLTFEPRPGFEDVTQGIGFSSVILEGLSLDDIDQVDLFVGRDTTPTDDDTTDFIKAFDEGVRNYDQFVVGTADDDFLSQGSSESGTRAIFGLAGDDVILPEDFVAADLFGGDGDDVLFQNFSAGHAYGGDGDDILLVQTSATLTGGEGADTFGIFSDDPVDKPVTITDFDLSEDTLDIGALLSVEVGEGVVEGTVTLEDVVRGGVAGTLVETSYEDVTGTVVDGPRVFLEGVQSDDIPDGTITFNPTVLGNSTLPTGGDPEFAENYDIVLIGTEGDDTLSQGTPENGTRAIFGLDGDDQLTPEDFVTTDLYGGDGDDTLLQNNSLGHAYGGDGDDTISVETSATLTGGEGADTFNVFRETGSVRAPTVITDFDVNEDGLNLDAVLIDLESQDGSPGVSSVAVENSTLDGVAGTLVTTRHFDGEERTENGPSVFLVGVDAADIPDGTFTFNPTIV